MDNVIVAEIITSSVVLIGIIVNIVKNRNQFKRTQKNLRYSIEYEEWKEKRERILKKLEEFYYPLKNFLERSKDSYKTFTDNKPDNFRTLEFLLDKDQKFDGKEITLSKNDHVLLRKIFAIGEEIENLISEKGSLVGEEEFTAEYIPDPKFADPEYPTGVSLLSFAQSHFGFIRDAYNGEINSELKRFKKYVYPRELNTRVEIVIGKLEKKLGKYERKMSKTKKKIR